MCKLSHWTFWILLPSCHFFHNGDYWQLLQSSAEPVIHKAEICSDLEFSSYQFLQISSSFLDFHTLDVVILQYHSSIIRVLNMQKIKQYTIFSALILPHCCYTHNISLVLCSLPSSSILLTLLSLSAHSPPYSPASVSRSQYHFSSTEEINSEREEKLGWWKGIFIPFPLVQLAVLCPSTEDFSSRTKLLGLGVRR